MTLRAACVVAGGLLIALPASAQVPLARAAAPSAAADAAPPPAPGLPNFVAVVLDGLAADSVRAPFMAGFRGPFSGSTFHTERPGLRAGTWLPGVPLSNRFRMIEGTPATGTWQAHVAIEWLRPGEAAGDSDGVDGTNAARGTLAKPTRTKGRAQTKAKPNPAKLAAPNFPGARVTYWALSPEAVAAGARATPERETLRFRFAPQAGPKFWSQAGRRAALLLLESLHHQSQDLDADLRLRLDDCDRGGP
jgi:hypothetical protein